MEDKAEISTQPTSQKKSLKFNLPPLHIMKQKVIPEVARDLVLNEKKVFQTKSIPEHVHKYEAQM